MKICETKPAWFNNTLSGRLSVRECILISWNPGLSLIAVISFEQRNRNKPIESEVRRCGVRKVPLPIKPAYSAVARDTLDRHIRKTDYQWAKAKKIAAIISCVYPKTWWLLPFQPPTTKAVVCSIYYAAWITATLQTDFQTTVSHWFGLMFCISSASSLHMLQ